MFYPPSSLMLSRFPNCLLSSVISTLSLHQKISLWKKNCKKIYEAVREPKKMAHINVNIKSLNLVSCICQPPQGSQDFTHVVQHLKTTLSSKTGVFICLHHPHQCSCCAAKIHSAWENWRQKCQKQSIFLQENIS